MAVEQAGGVRLVLLDRHAGEQWRRVHLASTAEVGSRQGRRDDGVAAEERMPAFGPGGHSPRPLDDPRSGVGKVAAEQQVVDRRHRQHALVEPDDEDVGGADTHPRTDIDNRYGTGGIAAPPHRCVERCQRSGPWWLR